MTAPRPYSEKPRWDEIGAIVMIGGCLVLLAGLATDWNAATKAGGLTFLAGLVVRVVADWVWEP